MKSLGLIGVVGGFISRLEMNPIRLDDVESIVRDLRTRDARKKIPRMIYFFGMDGAGKTTQIALIAKSLRQKGVGYKYVRMRWFGFLCLTLFGLRRALRCAEQIAARSTKVSGGDRNEFHGNTPVDKVADLFLPVDMALGSLLKVRIRRFSGCVLLSDRYAYDAIVDLEAETHQDDILHSLRGKLLASLVPHDAISMLIDLDEREALRRRHDIPNLEYLTSRRRLYLQLARSLQIPIVDGMRSIPVVHRTIVEMIDNSRAKLGAESPSHTAR
jgi:thymidylate kinase